MRDYRINKIFEGSSEIMHLFMAREAVDKHLQVAGAMIDPEKSVAEKLAELPKMTAFYASWYPTRWLGWGRWPRYQEFGELAGHLRFAERNTRRLSRQIFHGMIVHQAKLQNKQAFLFRLVDIANELFAMAASVARAHAMREAGHPDAANAVELADLFCRSSRRRVAPPLPRPVGERRRAEVQGGAAGAGRQARLAGERHPQSGSPGRGPEAAAGGAREARAGAGPEGPSGRHALKSPSPSGKGWG